MKPWIEEWGYPLVSVSVDYDSGDVTIRQKRFVSELNKVYGQPSSVTWTFQVLLRTSVGVHLAVWVDREVTVVNMGRDQMGQWVMVETVDRSCYRVNYDFTTWRRLTRAISQNASVFASAQKADLFDDSWALAFTGQTPLEVPLTLSLFAVVNETEDYLWEIVLHNMNSLISIYGDSSIQVCHSFRLPVIFRSFRFQQ